jgi:hypothetical protein
VARSKALNKRPARTSRSDNIASASRGKPVSATKPVAKGQITVLDRETLSVGPGKQITWYTSGPPGNEVTISLERIENSGGHLHAGGPIGSANPSVFVLGPTYPQNVPVIYTAPDAAGTVNIISHFSNGTVLVNFNNIAISGLVQVTASDGITLTGATPTHPQNHFGTPTLVSKIRQLAQSFRAKFGKDLFINDMSLPGGGLYDFHNDWTAPHKTHREGRTADINSTSMNQDERDFFRKTAQDLGFSVTLEKTPEHWHLYI